MLLTPEDIYFSMDIKGHTKKSINVKSVQFRLTYSNMRISYGAQGEQWKATVTDLQHPPSMTAAVHWLSVYAMLSRATSLEGLLISRLCTRAELEAGAPEFLRTEIQRLQSLEEKLGEGANGRCCESVAGHTP